MEGHTQWMSDDGDDDIDGDDDGDDDGGDDDNEGDGEDAPHDNGDEVEEDGAHVDGDQEGQEEHAADEDMSRNTPLTAAVQDRHVQELLLSNTSTDPKIAGRRKAKLDQLEVDSRTPLYDAARGTEESRLRYALDIMEMKAKHKWTDTSVDELFGYLKIHFPKDNTCAGSLQEAKKIVCPLDLPHQKYHACISDCVIYQNEHANLDTCPQCGESRYKRGTRKSPRKVVWYFPLTPRLQRYFVDPKEAKLMRWHAERKEAVMRDVERVENPVLTHPSDASQWKTLDDEYYEEFGKEPRNIRLGASTDGLNPFGNQSSKHSTWPVFVWMYNLPPWLCLKKKYIHMSMLIQGPTQPGSDINLYLELLKEELVTLWEEGIETWDAYGQETFRMKAALLTTLTEQAAAESAGSSSQTSTGKVPWDTPFIRGLNTVKARPLLDKPHRVPGAGGGRKLADYGLDVPASTKESRQAQKDREHEALLKKVADLETTMEQRVSAEVQQRVSAEVQQRVSAEVATKVDDAVASRVNLIIPDLVMSMKNYFAGGQKGPMPVISLGASNSDNRPPTRHAQCTPNLVTPPAGNVGAREDSPDLGGPSTSPSVTCTPGLGPSTRAELDALTENATPCTLLLNVDNKLKAVASGSVILPTQRIFHCVRMDDSVSRVRVNRSLPGCQDLHPPYQPPETETPLTLGDLKNHILLWPKALIRLNTASGSEASYGMVTPQDATDAPSQAKVPAPTTALTAGKGRASPPPADDHFEPDSQPDSQHESQHDKALDIDQAPIDTFIAEMEADAVSPYKPPAGHILKKKLFLSQETPEQEDTTAFTAPPRVGLTPRTLLGATTEGMKQNATPSCSKKKGRKRKKSGDVAASKIVVNDKLPTPWRKLHHIGQPMLPAHVVDKLTPDMRNVHETILMKEKLLLKERNPSYPILIAKVPTGFGFVNTYPADLIFIRYEDIFRLLHMQQLDRNLVRLVSLSMAHDIAMENTAHIAIMDPFYMTPATTQNEQAFLAKYIKDFLVLNKDKKCFVIPYFRELKYCTLLLFHPYHSHVTYLDSGLDKEKDFTDVKSTLDKALSGFIAEVGVDKLRHEKKVKGCHVCNHITKFPCLKQSADDNGMEAWFAILQMRAVMTYYVVYHGRVPGVYEDWEDCRRQVHRFSGNSYKGYTTLEEAETRYANFRAGQRREMWRTPFIVMLLAATASLVYYVIVV
ncbi:hypothetical protein QYE76_019060 [Lolium multiflorum]|uniref:Uncharacterized protein n=1 Tax=Lolium multiflorum TaxID=4521 RepID=A0AAD8R694_LOLMU|nr:hypothetical protein QYE76_019060 [Lolium multiflorum]